MGTKGLRWVAKGSVGEVLIMGDDNTMAIVVAAVHRQGQDILHPSEFEAVVG